MIQKGYYSPYGPYTPGNYQEPSGKQIGWEVSNPRSFYFYTSNEWLHGQRGKDCTLYLDTWPELKFLVTEIRSILWAATGYDISRPETNKLFTIPMGTSILSFIRDELRDPNSKIWNYMNYIMKDHNTVLRISDHIMELAPMQSWQNKYISTKELDKVIEDYKISGDNPTGYSVPSMKYVGGYKQKMVEMYSPEQESLYIKNTQFQR